MEAAPFGRRREFGSCRYSLHCLATAPKEAKSEQRGAEQRESGRFGYCIYVRYGAGGDVAVVENKGRRLGYHGCIRWKRKKSGVDVRLEAADQMAAERTLAIGEGEDVATARRALSESYRAARRRDGGDPIGAESVDNRSGRRADFGNGDCYGVAQTYLHLSAVQDKTALKVIQTEGDEAVSRESIIDVQGRSNRRPWGDKPDCSNREAQ